MIREEKNGIIWLKFDLLAEISNVNHAVFLRGEREFSLSGTSDAVQNQKEAADILGVSTIYSAKQCHGNEFRIIDKSYANEMPCDALMTNTPGIGVMIKHADCQGAILYDPVHHAVVNVHCGWRGSVSRIYEKVIEGMKKAYHTNPADLIACVGPSLGPESAEFTNYQKELPEEFWEYQVKPKMFDFWAITEMQLQRCGVLPDHIEIARIDTYQHERDCFSYRKNKSCGRHGTIVVLEQ